ncbi:hypothetical protein BC937DRAFT_87010, partial [Endogone sp. FLAS-F59071]
MWLGLSALHHHLRFPAWSHSLFVPFNSPYTNLHKNTSKECFMTHNSPPTSSGSFPQRYNNGNNEPKRHNHPEAIQTIYLAVNCVIRSPQMMVIDQTVTRLLMATKQLLESLTLWSNGRMSVQQIYEIFNFLCSQFTSASRAFEAANIPMSFPHTENYFPHYSFLLFVPDSFSSDLSQIPADLRVSIDNALAEPSGSLETHLPPIREVILKLLQGLKRKQAMYRERQQESYTEKSHEESPPSAPP